MPSIQQILKSPMKQLALGLGLGALGPALALLSIDIPGANIISGVGIALVLWGAVQMLMKK